MTVSAGDVILASDINNLVERKGTSLITADTTTWNATETVTTTTAATLVSGLRYKVWFTGRISTDVAADAANMRIREDNLTGTQLGFGQVYLPTTTANGWFFYLYAEYTAVSSASKTFALTGQRSIGTGTAHRVRASASAPAWFNIERIQE